jgi:hypothetical protein
LDPIMHGDSGAVLSRCIASGNATTLPGGGRHR